MRPRSNQSLASFVRSDLSNPLLQRSPETGRASDGPETPSRDRHCTQPATTHNGSTSTTRHVTPSRGVVTSSSRPAAAAYQSGAGRAGSIVRRSVAGASSASSGCCRARRRGRPSSGADARATALGTASPPITQVENPPAHLCCRFFSLGRTGWVCRSRSAGGTRGAGGRGERGSGDRGRRAATGALLGSSAQRAASGSEAPDEPGERARQRRGARRRRHTGGCWLCARTLRAPATPRTLSLLAAGLRSAPESAGRVRSLGPLVD